MEATLTTSPAALTYRGDAPSGDLTVTVGLSGAGPADLQIIIAAKEPTSLQLDLSGQTADTTIRFDRKAAYVAGDIVYGVILDTSVFGAVVPGAQAHYVVTGPAGGLTSVTLTYPEAFF